MFIKLLNFVAIFIFILNSQKAHAENPETVEYEKAYQLCQEFSSSNVLTQAMTAVEIAAKNFYQGGKTAVTVSNFELSSETKNLISSSAYQKALTNCFGSFSKNRAKWDSFTLLIIVSDAAGQSLTAVALPGVTVKVLKLVSSINILSKLPMIGKYLRQNPSAISYIEKSAKTLLLVGTLKWGYDIADSSATFLSPKYAKSKRSKEIKNEKLPQFENDFGQVFSDLKDAIEKEKQKSPQTEKTKARIAKLEKRYELSQVEYRNIKEKYLELAN
ncbi:MAG: hypothetical protein ACXVNF_14885 [Neobacillus sp.]